MEDEQLIKVELNGQREIKRALANYPREASRALEHALDHTARDIRDGIREEMTRVFDNPTRYTLNSLQITPTRNHNMKASVWFKEPDRMEQHYLVPQVEGGQRKLKGFERALDDTRFVPGEGVRLNKFGNVSFGQIRQILSVLGRAEHHAGYQANITARSRKTNTKARDYVYIRKRNGRLLPGVYERYVTSSGFNAKTKRTFADRSKVYQQGKKRGKFAQVIRARGLRPILIKGRQNAPTRPLLDFYGVANRVYNLRFVDHFRRQLLRRL